MKNDQCPECKIRHGWHMGACPVVVAQSITAGNSHPKNEREAFEAAWLAIHGGNTAWIIRADEDEQDDRLTYCEVWTCRAWLLWQRARTDGVREWREPISRDEHTQAQAAAVMLLHGTPEQKAEVAAAIGVTVPADETFSQKPPMEGSKG